MLLKRGDKGSDVIKLQEKLGVETVGVFGPKTEEAVKKFQSQNGKTPDGVVDDEIWSMIMKISYSLNINKLQGKIPDPIYIQLPEIISKFNINTPLRMAHFLSQCHHESSGFTRMKENLNYSASGLRKTFGKYFTNDDLAKAYERQPERIANRVYANRGGNGDEASRDGWKFRGRGCIQLTFYDNYLSFSNFIKDEEIMDNPDLVSDKYSLTSSAWFFIANKLDKKSDGGTSVNVIKDITRIINGGYNGLEERIKLFDYYYQILI